LIDLVNCAKKAAMKSQLALFLLVQAFVFATGHNSYNNGIGHERDSVVNDDWSEVYYQIPARELKGSKGGGPPPKEGPALKGERPMPRRFQPRKPSRQPQTMTVYFLNKNAEKNILHTKNSVSFHVDLYDATSKSKKPIGVWQQVMTNTGKQSTGSLALGQALIVFSKDSSISMLVSSHQQRYPITGGSGKYARVGGDVELLNTEELKGVKTTFRIHLYEAY
jgi:hypothetical protein